MSKKSQGATEEVKRIDALGRISLGKELANEPYLVTREKDGTIVLVPVAVIPKRELWLHQNPEALASLREGLRQSARGEAKYIGSFAQYADDEVGD